MASNLNSLFESLHFMKEEHNAIIDTTEPHVVSLAVDVKFGLVGKLLSPRLVNEVIHTFTNIWVDEHTDMFLLKNGIFLFKFSSENHLLSILRRRPWLFDGKPIVLVPFNPAKMVGEYDFSKIT
ncbi:hypothetical protein V6N11_082897 [Hibiscus sabdariffa]|uniref:DUF4283 domain-containing protein n=1 Tax=Hibiscus sabdariffa TaxID=183260 RepID=A0ABR2QK77_9ROSI